SVCVGNAPVACLELHDLIAVIGERDRIGPEEVTVLGRGAIGEEARHGLDLDLTGHGTISGLHGVHGQPAIPDLGVLLRIPSGSLSFAAPTGNARRGPL